MTSWSSSGTTCGLRTAPSYPGIDQVISGLPGDPGQCVNAKSDQRARGNRKRPSGQGPGARLLDGLVSQRNAGITGSPRHHPATRQSRQAQHHEPGHPSRPPRRTPDSLANATAPRVTRLLAKLGEGRWVTRGGVVLTVNGDRDEVERRLAGGELACPSCGGVLGGWGNG